MEAAAALVGAGVRKVLAAGLRVGPVRVDDRLRRLGSAQHLLADAVLAARLRATVLAVAAAIAHLQASAESSSSGAKGPRTASLQKRQFVRSLITEPKSSWPSMYLR